MVTAPGATKLPEELRRRGRLGWPGSKKPRRCWSNGRGDKALAEGKNAEEAKLAKKPQDKDQYNFTDPESRIMPGADGIVQGYNAQAAVEPTLLLIVRHRETVTEASNDKRQLKPMVELIEQQSGQRPQALLADNMDIVLEEEPGSSSTPRPRQAGTQRSKGSSRDGQAEARRASAPG